MITIREEVELNDQQKVQLVDELKKIISASEPAADGLKGLSDRAREFVAGNHSGNKQVSDGKTFSFARFNAMEDKNTPVVDLFPGEFAKIAGYVIGRQSKPYVVAEDRAMFGDAIGLPDDLPGDEQEPSDTEEPEAEDELSKIRETLGKVFPPNEEGEPSVTDSELFEAVGNARLDRFMERADWPRILRMALMTACRERVVGVHIGYNQDEATREPVFVSRIPAGDFGWDESAETFMQGRFIWRRERDVLAQDVAHDYTMELDKVLEACSGGDSERNKSMPDSMKQVTLMHVWRRNKEMLSVGGDERTPATSVYKYRAGWQYTILLGDKVLFNGHSTDPSGEPPFEFAGLLELPDAQFSLGLYDKMAAFNRIADELLHIITESARKSLKKIIVDTSGVKNPDVINNGEIKGVLFAKDGRDPRTIAHEIDGGGASAGIMETYDRLIQTMRETLGTLGLSAEDFGDDPSGVMLEGIKQDRSGIVSALIAPTFDAFSQRVLTKVLNFVLEYEDVPTTLKLIGADKNEHYVSLNVGKFGMKGSDIRPSFDVRVTRSQDDIQNPIKKAEHLTGMMKLFFEILDAKGPDAAELWLEAVEIQIKPQLRKFLNGIRDAENDPEAPQPSQEDMKVQADMAKMQADSLIKLKETAADSTADALERQHTGLVNAGELERADKLINEMPYRIEQAYMLAGEAPQQGEPDIQIDVPPEYDAEAQGLPEEELLP